MSAKRGQGNALASFLTKAQAAAVPAPRAAMSQSSSPGLPANDLLGSRSRASNVALVEFEPLDVGIYYDIPSEHYHADCAIEPSLSASFADTMLESTPKRAWATHPRLNPGAPPYEPTPAMDEGSILHRLILGVGPEFTVIDARDWRAEAAKDARRVARAAGEIPVLADKFEDLVVIAAAARRALEENEEDCRVLSDDYASEVTCISRVQSGALLRCRPDRLHKTDGSAPVYDFKFTDMLEHPTDWDRAVVNQGWDMRAAFYTRALCEVRDGEEAPYKFVVVEKKFPVDVMVFELTESFLKQGHQKAAAAIEGWERCMAANYWPGHPRRTFHVQEPGWAERSLRDKLYFLSGILPGGRLATTPAPSVTSLREFALTDGSARAEPQTIDNEDANAGDADGRPGALPLDPGEDRDDRQYDSPLG
jgi:hypothetical protein